MSVLIETVNGEKLTPREARLRNQMIAELLKYADTNHSACRGCTDFSQYLTLSERQHEQFPWRGNIHNMKYHTVRNWYVALLGRYPE